MSFYSGGSKKAMKMSKALDYKETKSDRKKKAKEEKANRPQKIIIVGDETKTEPKKKAKAKPKAKIWDRRSQPAIVKSLGPLGSRRV